MTWRDFTAQLLDVLRAHKLRTGLTMFGITWGIAFSLIMAGLSDSLQNTFVNELERIGQREVRLRPGHVNGVVGGYRTGRDLRFDDRTLPVLRANCPSLENASPEIWAGFAELKYRSRVRAFPLVGVEPMIYRIRRYDTARGRQLDDGDIEAARAVCYVGHNVQRRLFGSTAAAGNLVRINGHAFTVVGVAAPKGDAMFRSGTYQDDDMVLIPASTAQRLFVQDPNEVRHDGTTVYSLQSVTREASYTLIEEVRRVLGALYGFAARDRDALVFVNLVDNVMKVMETQNAASVLTHVVNVTTLLIGAIGLMNILIVSVNERTREIGLRRALGATRREILRQFLAESLAVTVVAGTAGVALALLLKTAMTVVPLPDLLQAPAIPPGRIVVAFLSMVATALFAGFVPARRAAGLDPAIALRHE